MRIKVKKDGGIVLMATNEEIKHYNLNELKVTLPVEQESKVNITRDAVLKQAEVIEEWVVKTFRPLFKKTRPRKSMGDRNRCMFNMALFTLTYTEYSLDDIQKAVKAHIESFDGVFVDEMGRHTKIRQADYFVFKTIIENGRKVVISDLLTILEDHEDDTPVKVRKEISDFI